VQRTQLDPSFVEACVDRVVHGFDRPDGPGLSVGVLSGDWVVLRRGYGLGDVERRRLNGPDVPMRIASLSKQFLVTLVLMLEQEGALSVGDDVRKHLPFLPKWTRTVRLIDLMSNQSGVRDFLELRLLSGGNFADPATEDESMALVQDAADLNFDPGTRFAYSNSGFMLLTRIVEKVLGAPLEQVLSERIFGPLAMRDTRLVRRDEPVIPDRAIPYVESRTSREIGKWGVPLDGAGGIVSTIDDLLIWADNLRRPKIATAGIFARMCRATPYRDGADSIYGLGMTVMVYRGLRSFGHHGQLPGVGAEIVVFPDTDTAILLIANTSALNPFALGRRIADELLADRLHPIVPAEPPASLPPAGIYHDPVTDAVIEIVATGEADRSIATAMVQVPIERHAPGRFRPLWPMNHLDLAFSADGALVGHDGPRPVRFKLLPPHGALPAELAKAEGRFVQAGLKSEWTIERNGMDLEFRVVGPFGAQTFALRCLAPGLFQARPRNEPVGSYLPVIRIAGKTGQRRLSLNTDRTFDLTAIEQ
jgi:D-aminopeptidase